MDLSRLFADQVQKERIRAHLSAFANEFTSVKRSAVSVNPAERRAGGCRSQKLQGRYPQRTTGLSGGISAANDGPPNPRSCQREAKNLAQGLPEPCSGRSHSPRLVSIRQFSGHALEGGAAGISDPASGVEYHRASRIESRERAGERVAYSLTGAVNISQHSAVADDLNKTGLKGASDLPICDG